MANITSVGVTSGVPTSGTGTVSTLDNLIAVAGTPTANVQTVQGVAGMTAVKVDGSAVTQPISGSVTVSSAPSTAVTNAGTFAVQATNATASNLNAAVVGLGTAGTSTGGVLSVQGVTSGTAVAVTPAGTLTSWGLAVSTQNTTAPVNANLVSGQFNTTPTTITSGNVSPLQMDNAGNLLVNIKAGAGSGGTASTVGSAAPTQATAVGFSDGTNMVLGRVKAASTAPVATDPALVVAISPNSVNANGLATPANSAPVVASDGYSQYETVAASATAQVLGATGATGDYLAGVTVFPGTAGCGVVTILDNATTWGTFAGGGTTALPSLVPFVIPVGCFSTSGAWKITTGANVTCVGIGKFT